MRTLSTTALALALTAAMGIVGPVAAATAASPTPDVSGGYKGRIAQGLVTTVRLTDRRVQVLTTTVRRYCSDGTTSYARVTYTGLDQQADSKLQRTPTGATFKVTASDPSSGSSVWSGKLTARKNGQDGVIKGRITFSDVASLPMGPGDGNASNTPPAAGATCSTSPTAASSSMTFTTPWG